MRRRYLITPALLAVLSAHPPIRLAAQDHVIAIRGGTVLPISGPAIPNGTVLIRGSRIAAVGANVAVPAGAEIVDARGKFVMPGVVDAASTIGIEASDLNESDPVTPGLRAFESYNPYGTFGAGKPGPLRNTDALSGGVTTMYLSPADASLIGGQGFIVKSAGANLDALVVRDPAAMDMALGTPPKAAARGRNRDPYTRMAEVAMIRQALIKATEYQRNRLQTPTLHRDLGMEALGRLLKREFPARIQANSATDIRAALRLGQEFGVDVVIDGGAGAWEVKDDLAARRIPVVLGQVSHPYVSNEEIPDKDDYPPVDERLAGRLTGAGIPTAIATFSRAFGSLEAGKDADVIILDGPPLSVKTWVQRAYVNGELVYQK